MKRGAVKKGLEEWQLTQRRERAEQRRNPLQCQAAKNGGHWPCRRRARVQFRGKGYCVGHFRALALPVPVFQPKMYRVVDGDLIFARFKKGQR